jgi:drug/metabolite transporter (DMT)-like permease
MPLRPLAVAFVALGAAFCYASSNVIEHRKATQAPPETSMRIALLWHLARQPIWWVGILVDVGGFALQATALELGSLVFVQPLLVTSLLFSLGLGAAAGSHRLSRGDLTWAVILILALTAFLLVASGEGGADQRPAHEWILPLAATGALVLLLGALASRSNGPPKAALLGAAAGTCFGVSSTLMKTFSHLLADGGPWAVLTHWEPYALGLVVAIGFLFVQSSFQAGDLRAALPALEVAEPIVASLLGVTLMREHLDVDSAGEKTVVLFAAVVMVWSAIVLARSAASSRAPADTHSLSPT